MSLSSTTTQPNLIVTSNTKKDTYVDVHASQEFGALLYQPDLNLFIALYPEEWNPLSAQGMAHNNAIEDLQAANQAVTDKSLVLAQLRRNPAAAKADLQKAQDELNQALSDLSAKSDAAKSCITAITDVKTDPKKLVEVLPLTLKSTAKHKAYYISADKIKSAMADQRVYLVEGKAERSKPPTEKLLNGTVLNTKELKKRIAEKVIDKAKFTKEWKLKPETGDEYTGQFLQSWSKAMGADAKEFLEREQKQITDGILTALHTSINTDPKDPHRNIDLKPEAQLMRWSAGGGLSANLLPFQGNLYDKRDKNWQARFKRAAKAAQFNVKANAEAAFAAGEAKVQTIAYYPHFAGWHALTDVSVLPAPLDMGHFRFRGDMTLYALAGASIALEASAALMLTAGKQGLRGVPKSASTAKAKVGGSGEVQLFAGLKEGIGLAGAMQWLNPEGFIDPNSPKRKDLHSTWGEYVDVGTLNADASLIQGLAATLGLEVDFKGGNFIFAVKAGGCLGLGGEGSMGGKVGAAQIGEFFMCVAHQLKQADYKKIAGLMKPPIFNAYNYVLYMVATGEKTFESILNSGVITSDDFKELYKDTLNTVKQRGANFIKQLEQKLRSQWGWYAYMPPEARGAMIASIADIMQQPQNAGNRDLQLMAAFSVNELISTMQTTSHLDNTLDRITVAMGDVLGSASGVNAINSLLQGTPYADAINRANTQLASAQPLIQRPFLRNDESSFIAAQFPLQHPASTMTT